MSVMPDVVDDISLGTCLVKNAACVSCRSVWFLSKYQHNIHICEEDVFLLPLFF